MEHIPGLVEPSCLAPLETVPVVVAKKEPSASDECRRELDALLQKTHSEWTMDDIEAEMGFITTKDQ